VVSTVPRINSIPDSSLIDAIAAFVSSSTLPVGRINTLAVLFDSAHHFIGFFRWNESLYAFEILFARYPRRQIARDLADGVEDAALIGFRQFSDSPVDLFLNGRVR